ncbi:hypothetical protein F5884DRAFT_163892 [Xylogone sp. PMI_703]|nr:hypothetical protein F5884DRAFT_163892 [Xylogone sp. PMI_703]
MTVWNKEASLQQKRSTLTYWANSNIETLPAMSNREICAQAPQKVDSPFDEIPLLGGHSSSTSTDQGCLSLSDFCPTVIDMIYRRSGDRLNVFRTRSDSVDVAELFISLKDLRKIEATGDNYEQISSHAPDTHTPEDIVTVVADPIVLTNPRASLNTTTAPNVVDSTSQQISSGSPATKIDIGRRPVEMIRSVLRRGRRAFQRKKGATGGVANNQGEEGSVCQY